MRIDNFYKNLGHGLQIATTNVGKKDILKIVSFFSFVIVGLYGIYLLLGRVKKKVDERRAFLANRILADQGEAEAQFKVGLMYRMGEGVKQNNQEAAKYYRLAADQEHAQAQLVVGFIFENACGVLRSEKEAIKYYRLSADQGNVHAQCYLGHLYKGGKLVEQSNQEAAKYFRLAAEQGNKVAIEALAELQKLEKA